MSFPYIQRARWLRLHVVTAKDMYRKLFWTSNVPYGSFRQDVCEMSFPYIQRARWLRLYVTAKDVYNSVHRLEFIHRMCSRYASTSAAIRA